MPSAEPPRTARRQGPRLSKRGGSDLTAAAVAGGGRSARNSVFGSQIAGDVEKDAVVAVAVADQMHRGVLRQRQLLGDPVPVLETVGNGAAANIAVERHQQPGAGGRDILDQFARARRDDRHAASRRRFRKAHGEIERDQRSGRNRLPSSPARQSCSSEKTSWPTTKPRKLERAGNGSRIGLAAPIDSHSLSKKLTWRLTRMPRTVPSGSRKTLTLTLTSSGLPRNISTALSSGSRGRAASARTGSRRGSSFPVPSRARRAGYHRRARQRSACPRRGGTHC